MNIYIFDWESKGFRLGETLCNNKSRDKISQILAHIYIYGLLFELFCVPGQPEQWQRALWSRYYAMI